MPYDPRPVTEGGNRGIDILFERKAPAGKYRVVGVDTFDGGDWLVGTFDTEAEARERAEKEAGSMNMRYVYDDKGSFVARYGTF